MRTNDGAGVSPVEPSADGVQPNPRRWVILGLILTAALMAQFDLFVVNVAAPTIQSDLRASTAAIQIAIGGYSLTYGVLLIPGGRLGDAFGAVFTLKVGMLLFAGASLLCAIAQSGSELVVARLLQGVCAALMVPQVLAMVTLLFPQHERRRATSWFGVTLGLGAALGQSLGGLFVAHGPFGLGWRTIFLVVVPLAAGTAYGIARIMPSERRSGTPMTDPVGLAGISSSLLLLFLFLTLGPGSDWPVWSWALLVAAIVVGVGAVRWEKAPRRRGQHPVLNTELFSHRTFQIGLLVNIAYFLAFGGFLFAMTFTLQIGLGETAQRSGLTFVPQGVGFACASLVGVRVASVLGSRLVTIGATTSASACALVLLQAHLGEGDLRPLHLLPTMALLGIGNGLAIPAMIASVLQIVAPRSAGTAAGILTTAQQVAMAFGVAVFGFVLTTVVGNAPSKSSYLRGLEIDLVIATGLLAMGALASCLLPAGTRRRAPSPTTVPR